MFTVNNIIIAFFATGLIAVIMITIYLSTQFKKVNNIMKHNKDVTPLLLQKSTQHKFNTIRTKLPHAPSVHQERLKNTLEELVTNFRNETICIKTYNKGLDNVMSQLKKHS
jgi:uncharacterized membrane protein YraQ (UPF0718 family)